MGRRPGNSESWQGKIDRIRRIDGSNCNGVMPIGLFNYGLLFFLYRLGFGNLKPTVLLNLLIL